MVEGAGIPNCPSACSRDILRIEIEKERFSDFIAIADKITAKMKELGFVYITLDAEGFRSGSMDVHIVK